MMRQLALLGSLLVCVASGQNSTSSSSTSSSRRAICTRAPPPEPPASAASCHSSLAAYLSQQTSSVVTYNSSTDVEVSRSTNTDVPITTLCDGRPRALKAYTTFEYTTTRTFMNQTQTLTRNFFPPGVTMPACTIADGSDECRAVHSSWSYASSYNKACGTGPRSYYNVHPTCTQNTHCALGTGAHCLVEGTSARLLYWPVTTVGDFCGNTSTITPTPTAPDGSPNTVVFQGGTYTSPSVYYIFTASAYRNTRGGVRGWEYCGPTKPVTVTVQPSEVSSVLAPIVRRRRGARFPPSSFNWAHMNTVPADVFTTHCNFWKWPGGCETVRAGWSPDVTVPSQVLVSDDEWHSCTAGVPLEGVQYVALGVSSGNTTGSARPSLPKNVEAVPTSEPDSEHFDGIGQR